MYNVQTIYFFQLPYHRTCAGSHHITSSLIHDSLSRAKVIWKQHIPKRGFPRSDRTKMIDRIFMLHFPRHLCRAAFTILEMLVLPHALSPPEKVNNQHSIFSANVVQILNITSCHLNHISDIGQVSRIRVSQSVSQWSRPLQWSADSIS